MTDPDDWLDIEDETNETLPDEVTTVPLDEEGRDEEVLTGAGPRLEESPEEVEIETVPLMLVVLPGRGPRLEEGPKEVVIVPLTVVVLPGKGPRLEESPDDVKAEDREDGIRVDSVDETPAVDQVVLPTLDVGETGPGVDEMTQSPQPCGTGMVVGL